MARRSCSAAHGLGIAFERKRAGDERPRPSPRGKREQRFELALAHGRVLPARLAGAHADHRAPLSRMRLAA